MQDSAFYQKHVFFCTNLRENGRLCCQQHDAEQMRAYLKQRLQKLGKHGCGDFRINSSGCLGRCELGPCIVIYPEGIWYTYNSIKDIEQILNEHLLHNRIVERLLIPARNV